MYPNHKPKLVHRLVDDTWMVDCLECRDEGNPPIGIGLPVQDRIAAEMIRDNHQGPKRVERVSVQPAGARPLDQAATYRDQAAS